MQLAVVARKITVSNRDSFEHVKNLSAFVFGAFQVSRKVTLSPLDERGENVVLTFEVSVGAGNAASKLLYNAAHGKSFKPLVVYDLECGIENDGTVESSASCGLSFGFLAAMAYVSHVPFSTSNSLHRDVVLK